jgi:hypothetical protein
VDPAGSYPLRGEVEWIPASQGGRTSGNPAGPVYATISWREKVGPDTGLASFVLRGFDPARQRSSAEGRWLVRQSASEFQVDAGEVIVVAEGIEAYFAQQQERHQRVEAEVLDQPWTPVAITVNGVQVEFRHTSYGERWAAISRIDQTTITIVSHGRSPGEVALVIVPDLAPHVEYARRRERERIEHRLAEHAISWEQYRPTRSPQNKARRAAVGAVVDGLTNALDRKRRRARAGQFFHRARRRRVGRA